MKLNLFISLAMTGVLVSCAPSEKPATADPIQEIIQVADQQIGFQTRLIEESGKVLIPRTVKNDKVHYHYVNLLVDEWKVEVYTPN